MRNIFIVILMIALLMKIDGGRTPAADSKAATYVDGSYHFSISPPEFGQSYDSVIPVIFTAPAANGFGRNVNVMITMGRQDRATYTQQTKSAVTEKNGVFNEIKELRVSDRDAAIYDYELVIEGRELHFLALAVFEADRVDLITCTDLAHDFAGHRDDYQNASTASS